MKISRLIKCLIAAFLTIGLAVTLTLVLPAVVFNVNTMHTVTSMSFIDGYACVSTDYTGYENALDILVNVRIERKSSAVAEKSRFLKSKKRLTSRASPLWQFRPREEKTA